MIDFVVVLVFLFVENGFFASICLVIENGYRSFTDIAPMYRNHPFISLEEELFQGMNVSSNTAGFINLAREVWKNMLLAVNGNKKTQKI